MWYMTAENRYSWSSKQLDRKYSSIVWWRQRHKLDVG